MFRIFKRKYMSTTNDVIATSKTLKEEYPTLTTFEALQIACKVENIDAFKRAFMVSDNPEQPYPVALEALAISQGFEKKGK